VFRAYRPTGYAPASAPTDNRVHGNSQRPETRRNASPHLVAIEIDFLIVQAGEVLRLILFAGILKHEIIKLRHRPRERRILLRLLRRLDSQLLRPARAQKTNQGEGGGGQRETREGWASHKSF
jgi:hypothetical protein